MKVTQTTMRRVLATELLAVRPVEYFVVVGIHNIQLIRVRGRAHTDLLLYQAVQDSNAQGFDTFCRELTKDPSFIGQPIKLLIDNSYAFTYVKRLDDVTPAQLFDKLSSIPKDNLETSQTTFTAGNSKVFIWQGIDRTYLDSIKQSVNETNLPVTEISTLAAHFLVGGPQPNSDRSAIYLYRLSPEDQWYSIFTTNSDILFGRLTETVGDNEPDTVFTHLAETYGLPTDSERILFDPAGDTTSPTVADRRPLDRLFSVGPKQQKMLRPLSHHTDSSRTTNALRVACNSTRLLAAIVVTATLLLTVAAGITSLWSNSLTEPIDDFQHRYSTKLELSRQRDLLQEQESQLSSDQGKPHQTAAIASAFCQKAFNKLFLTQLTIQYAEDDQILIEAQGASRRESTVFTLREHLVKQLKPHPVTVNSLKPQRSARGTPDSLFTFGLSVKIDE